MVICGTLILWHPVKAFLKMLKADMEMLCGESQWATQDRNMKWIKIINQYNVMRELAAMINLAIGNLVTLFVCGATLGYGHSLDQIFTEFKCHNWRRVVLYAFNMITDVLVYVIASCLCQNVG